ncbi:MAG: flagellar biosynthesis anti-sigma factor FlgM [Myxococcaceae bacterium]|jgi:anti-sigma28 factor (negative regulator of flagellin synthesis)|nr:flagellar biosynthesis anti-sigma factor FlgM [Myxococcaceae bacterium]
MKVNDQKAGQIVPLAAQRAASSSEKAPTSATEPTEKVSVSSSSDAVALRAAEGAAAASRAQRVQEIISAVKNGQYYPSPQQIANQLVSEAEIEAKLRALLG